MSPSDSDMPPELLGTSPPVETARAAVRAAAADRTPVLVVAEPGLSALRVARAIHAAGPAPATPLVAIDCGATPAREVARVLFGGAVPPGSDDLVPVASGGLFARANDVTLVLSDVAGLPASMQAALERVLRDGEVSVGGAAGRRPVRVRVIAGVGAAPADELAAGRLRRELHRRLAGHLVIVPSLRERPTDVAAVAEAVVAEVAAGVNGGRRRPAGFTTMAMALLQACPWRENVAELRRLLERVVPTGAGGRIQMEDLLAHVRLDGVATRRPAAGTLRAARRQFERDYVAAALARHEGRVAETARALGIQRTNLYRKLRQLGVSGGSNGTREEDGRTR